MPDYSSHERFLSWYYFEPEQASVFFHSTDLLECEVNLLLKSIDESMWIMFGGPEGDRPPSLIIEPSVDENPSRFVVCFREYSDLIDDFPTRAPRESQILFDEAWALTEKIRELRKFKRVGHYLRADCGGGPETFGFVDSLTGEQFNAVSDIMTQECHDLRCIFESVSEYDRIGNETLWLQCGYEWDSYGCEPHSDLWEIAQKLIAKFCSHKVDAVQQVTPNPVFDGQRLLVGDSEICTVSRKAANQHLILSAFEEQGWPERIDDPLPGGADSQRLRETIRSLNERQNALQFLADGSGKGLTWVVRGRCRTRATP